VVPPPHSGLEEERSEECIISQTPKSYASYGYIIGINRFKGFAMGRWMGMNNTPSSSYFEKIFK
jgi:hypothetical protein